MTTEIKTNRVIVTPSKRDFQRGVKYCRKFGGRFLADPEDKAVKAYGKCWELPWTAEVKRSLRTAGSYGLVVCEQPEDDGETF